MRAQVRRGRPTGNRPGRGQAREGAIWVEQARVRFDMGGNRPGRGWARNWTGQAGKRPVRGWPMERCVTEGSGQEETS